jgi:serine/threonine protein kinase
MKRERKEDDSTKFVLGKLLGQGTYNCAYLLKNQEGVLRIGLLEDGESEIQTMLLRGLEMINVFNQFIPKLGPSMLREITRYKIIDEQDIGEYVVGDLSQCRVVPDVDQYSDPSRDNAFALQHVELLRGGDLDQLKIDNELTPDEDRLCIFSLLWFFASAQQLFGYRHHDLKGANITVRFTDTAEKSVFTILDNEKTHYYVFEHNFVPVVIDYDFASVYTTKGYDHRTHLGTGYTASPDAIAKILAESALEAYMSEEEEEEEDEDERKPWKDYIKTYNPYVYDYWSLGISIMQFMWPRSERKLKNLFQAEMTRFIRDLATTSVFEPIEHHFDPVIMHLLYSACIAAVVANSTLTPPEEYYGYLSKLVLNQTKSREERKTDLWPYWNNVMKKSDDFALLQRVFNALDENLKDILRQLLNWNPSMRNANNKPMELILKSNYFTTKQTLTKQELGGAVMYQGTNTPIDFDEKLIEEDQQRLKQYHLLENKVCGGCGIEPQKKEVMYLCSCCAGVFCGEECQRIKH